MPTFPRVSVPHVPHHSPLNVNFIAHIIFITKLLQSAVAVYASNMRIICLYTTRHLHTTLPYGLTSNMQLLCRNSPFRYTCYLFISFLFFPFFLLFYFLSRLFMHALLTKLFSVFKLSLLSAGHCHFESRL